MAKRKFKARSVVASPPSSKHVQFESIEEFLARGGQITKAVKPGDGQLDASDKWSHAAHREGRHIRRFEAAHERERDERARELKLKR